MVCCQSMCLLVQDIAGFEGNIPVAVKTLTSRDPEIINKFREEAELMKKFSHPNIVSLLGKLFLNHTCFKFGMKT